MARVTYAIRDDHLILCMLGTLALCWLHHTNTNVNSISAYVVGFVYLHNALVGDWNARLFFTKHFRARVVCVRVRVLLFLSFIFIPENKADQN